MELLNIVERQNKKITIIAVLIAIASILSTSIIVLVMLNEMNKSKDTIYALDPTNNAFILQRVKENREAEAEAHFEKFHQLFFNLSPDPSVNKTNIENLALYLIDRSGKVYYDKLVAEDFFNSITVSNLTQNLVIDSIKVTKQNPHKAVLWGKLYIISADAIMEKNLVTTGVLRDTRSRSPKNAHGFIIEQFRILDNKEIKTYKRR